MEGEEWEREADGVGGGEGAGPSSLAVAKENVGREGGAAGAGGPSARPGVVASLQQQQQQRRVIRWERFLPRRSLRVLLVEQDDSTRHIVTALLRKCSYHVAAVADGLKAWDILKEKNYNFDLVLSEVEVPFLSGISLLCKIMAKELSKNIPVIMMSSDDSVSVVFRCMQKGAVDFLVKPVRKNELRNLWQHVWRRHCSTSFANGPENMPNNQTVSENMSDNNAASNNVSANAGKGSGTSESCGGDDNQNSGSKPLMGNESSKQQSMALLVDERKFSRVMKSQSLQLDDDIGTLANASKNHDDDKEKDSSPSWELSLRRPQLNGCVKNGFQEKNILNHSAASAFSRYAHAGICLPGQKPGFSSATICINTRENADDKCQSQLNSHDSQNERPTPFVPDGRLELSRGNKEKAMVYLQISSSNDEDAEPRASVPSGEDICTGHSAAEDHATFPHPQLGMMPLPIPIGAVPFQTFCSGYGPILQPMFYHESTVSPHGSAALEHAKCLTSSDQPTDCVYHVNADIQPTAFNNCDEDRHPCLLQLRKKHNTVDAEQGDPRRPRTHICGSEENTDQSVSYSMDTINGGGSNRNSGSADAAVNMRTAFECNNESGLQNYRCKGVDPHHSHREAALIKFRLKRKDRCFEKKVRYHSRKMLAEQRPRVKGQFVRQAIIDSNTTATEVDD